MVVSNVSVLMSLTSKFDLDSRHALEPIVHCGSGADNPDAGSSTTGMSEDERHLLAIFSFSFRSSIVRQRTKKKTKQTNSILELLEFCRGI